MGSGKTSIGKKLSKMMKFNFIDTDHIIEERTGVDIPTIFEHEGEFGFREREKNILYSRRLNDNPTTLEDLSKQYKISRERVRQIENKAFEKLQKHMLLLAKSNNLLPVN